MKRLGLILFIASLARAAEKPKPVVEPATQEEARAGYDLAVQWISARLKAPSTAHFQPVEELMFCPDCRVLFRRHLLAFKLYVDAQNSYGAMLRHTWVCGVDRQGQGKVQCFDMSR